MAQVSATNDFHDHDIAAKQGSRFLGIIPIKYIKTLHGLVHAVASIMALLLGNYLCLMQIILDRKDSEHLLTAKKYFFLCNMLSGTITMFFFWNKVQSFMLSTTPPKDRGVVTRELQNLNRSRGVITPIINSILPLMIYYYKDLSGSLFPEDNVLAVIPEIIACLTILALANKIFQLLRGSIFSVFVLLMYGSYPAGIALTALVNNGGSLTTLFATYPTLLDACEKHALMILTCVQYAYLWYYFYSRRLVSMEFVGVACTYYHSFLTYAYFGRTMADGWWNRSLPLFVKFHSVLFVVFVAFSVNTLAKKAKLFGTRVKVVSKGTD